MHRRREIARRKQGEYRRNGECWREGRNESESVERENRRRELARRKEGDCREGLQGSGNCPERVKQPCCNPLVGSVGAYGELQNTCSTQGATGLLFHPIIPV